MGHWLIYMLTHRYRVTHICINKLTIIVSDSGLAPGRRQAIIWTNAEILFIGPLGTNSSETFIEIYTFSVKKMHLKMSSGEWRPFCFGLNYVLRNVGVPLNPDTSVTTLTYDRVLLWCHYSRENVANVRHINFQILHPCAWRQHKSLYL